MKKDSAERKAAIIEKINKLKEEYKQLEKADKIKERKARTKELIEIGADIKNNFSERQIMVLRKYPKEKLTNLYKWLDEHSHQFDSEGNFINLNLQDPNNNNY